MSRQTSFKPQRLAKSPKLWGVRENLNPEIQTAAGKVKFRDDVINYEGAQLRAVYLVTAESAQPLHPDERP